mgnify:FL=1
MLKIVFDQCNPTLPLFIYKQVYNRLHVYTPQTQVCFTVTMSLEGGRMLHYFKMAVYDEWRFWRGTGHTINGTHNEAFVLEHS